MYWQEQNQEKESILDSNVTDVLFNIQCKMLPVDHIFELSNALLEILPWLNDLENAAIHAIHVAESGNGWMRPPDGDYLHLSRRTKLILRLPVDKVQKVSETLIDCNIQVASNALTIGQHKLRPIQSSKTVFSRYVVCESGQSENDFMQQAIEQLKDIDVHPKKMLCGKPHTISGAQAIYTRSLMIADLSKSESIRLQQLGLGSHSLLGCGIFLPHKGIDAIKEAADNKLPTSFGL